MNIFIHRRDMRIQDNTTLLEMSEKLGEISPIFIFNPQQIYEKNNKYFSNNLVEFLCNSLQDLDKYYKKKNIKLNLYEGETISVLNNIHNSNKINNKNKIKSLGFNRDYSPFSKKRDKEIENWCKKNNIEFYCLEDMLLSDIESENGLNPSKKKPYVVFTPFMKNLKKYDVREVNTKNVKGSNISIKTNNSIDIEKLGKYYEENENRHVIGSRKEGIKILKNIKSFNSYDKERSNLSYSTTNLSAYINLGLLSIREIYYTFREKLGNDCGLISELYWRDFYYNILYHFPKVIGKSFKDEYNKVQWSKNKTNLEKWKLGKTGYPVVDAAMTQLNTTGYMHNRGRMIVASFLTKDLQIDWKEGERYFANQLIDYNMSANNGGWQWAAGTGTDAQPYFRIFNPWTQSQKFDSDCSYIKKWLPVLKDIPNKHIHQWDKYCKEHDIDYPEPIVDHSEARKLTLEMYKKYL